MHLYTPTSEEIEFYQQQLRQGVNKVYAYGENLDHPDTDAAYFVKHDNRWDMCRDVIPNTPSWVLNPNGTETCFYGEILCINNDTYQVEVVMQNDPDEVDIEECGYASPMVMGNYQELAEAMSVAIRYNNPRYGVTY